MFKIATTTTLLFSTIGLTEAKLRGVSSSDSQNRKLATSITGPCTVANFSSKISGGKSKLASLLGTSTNTATMQAALDAKCSDALEGTV